MNRNNTEQKKGLFSALRQRLCGSTDSDLAGERFFIEHSRDIDRFTCYELSVILLTVLISLFIEVFSDNENLVRGDRWTLYILYTSMLVLSGTLAVGVSGRERYRPWFRYLAVFTAAIVNMLLTSYTVIAPVPFMLFPIFLACFYYDTLYVAVTTVLILASRVSGIVIYYGKYLTEDHNDLIEMGITGIAKNYLDTLDTVLILLSGVFCVLLCRSLRRIMEEKLHKEQEKTILDRDMDTAGRIQKAMLVKKFPVRDEYEVSAYMMPARMVGGDFYDFIELDNDRVVLVTADVSGKGMQASLYMSQVKAMINVYAKSENSTDKIAEKTNAYLTAGSPRERLFVTVWIGILDLKTGMLSYTNAGHNPPCLSTDGKAYGFMDSKVNFVLGGKPLVKYSENRIRLKPGDRLFLYTDGVTEAKNAEGSFYGEKALLDCLNECTNAAPKETIETLKSSLKAYAGEAEQYDDITMLAFSFKELAAEKKKAGRSFPADRTHFAEAIQYIRSECESIGCPAGVNKDIEIACSELIANICSYAYEGKKGEFEVTVEGHERDVEITFKDRGKPFDPLLNGAPDTSVGLAGRKAGGFGIFIVKKLMNDVLYRYENGCNVLAVKKQFK